MKNPYDELLFDVQNKIESIAEYSRGGAQATCHFDAPDMIKLNLRLARSMPHMTLEQQATLVNMITRVEHALSIIESIRFKQKFG